MDSVCANIMDLTHNKKVVYYTGNYSTYIKTKQEFEKLSSGMEYVLLLFPSLSAFFSVFSYQRPFSSPLQFVPLTPSLPFPIYLSSVHFPSSFGIPACSPRQTVLHVATTSSLHPSLPNPHKLPSFRFTAISLFYLRQLSFTLFLTILPISPILPPNSILL